MKYLVISDVHGNYPALEAVLSDAPSYDGIICVGDIVGLNGFPHETTSFLKDNADYAIKGNHDVAVIDYEEGHVNSKELSQFEYEYTWDELTKDEINWIQSLNSYQEIPDEGILLAHAQPTPELASGYEAGNAGVRKGNYVTIASQVDTDRFSFVLLGHTHDQAVLDCSRFGHNVWIVNPGSVGQPIGTAEYAIIDTELNTAEGFTVTYDGTETRETIRDKSPLIWW